MHLRILAALAAITAAAPASAKPRLVLQNGHIFTGDPNVVDEDLSYVVIEPNDAKLVAKAIIAMARDIQGKTPF